MYKNLIICCAITLCVFQTVFSQKINGKVIDSISLLPIPNVAIQINKDVGDFSDEGGLFSLELSENAQITFSCLGYRTKILSLETLKIDNYIVKLNNKLLNLPHLKDLYFIEVFNFMFKFILLIKKYNKVQSNLYWVKYVKTFI